ncbi:UNVERIFIED_CONTAM: hypothetical protein Sradi_2720900 [Sesamum radiatum]|uniref:Uncharacterized protein n=1 Tax=Sesamum radiatum TaxID=300843 RepID=A0AAW2S9K8_SESRA
MSIDRLEIARRNYWGKTGNPGCGRWIYDGGVAAGVVVPPWAVASEGAERIENREKRGFTERAKVERGELCAAWMLDFILTDGY